MPAMTTRRKSLRVEATKKRLKAAKSRFEKAEAVVRSSGATIAALERELELIEAWPVVDGPAGSDAEPAAADQNAAEGGAAPRRGR